jgi:hypothetical protein
MGDLLGNAVRLGVANDVLAAGEGIETMLSLRCVLPTLPMAAALSANHLAAMLLPLTLRRLYIARDADAAGDTGSVSERSLSPQSSRCANDRNLFDRIRLLVPGERSVSARSGHWSRFTRNIEKGGVHALPDPWYRHGSAKVSPSPVFEGDFRAKHGFGIAFYGPS